MKLRVDTREKINVLGILKQLGIPYERIKLDAGDYDSNRCTAERKTLFDLIGSIEDNSFFDQMERLRDQCEKQGKIPWLFVSGDFGEVSDFFQRRGVKLNEKSILGAMASAAVRYGVQVFRALDDRELLWSLHSIFEKVEEGKWELPQRKSLKRDKDRKVALWSTILRVDSKIVRRILNNYPTLKVFLEVLEKSPGRLTLIDGIGPGMVKKWKEVFE